jgi:hypothetical protein
MRAGEELASAGSVPLAGHGAAAAPSLPREVGAVEAAGHWVAAEGAGVIAALEAAGWWIGTPLLERDASRRLDIMTSAEVGSGASAPAAAGAA